MCQFYQSLFEILHALPVLRGLEVLAGGRRLLRLKLKYTDIAPQKMFRLYREKRKERGLVM